MNDIINFMNQLNNQMNIKNINNNMNYNDMINDINFNLNIINNNLNNYTPIYFTKKMKIKIYKYQIKFLIITT